MLKGKYLLGGMYQKHLRYFLTEPIPHLWDSDGRCDGILFTPKYPPFTIFANTNLELISLSNIEVHIIIHGSSKKIKPLTVPSQCMVLWDISFSTIESHDFIKNAIENVPKNCYKVNYISRYKYRANGELLGEQTLESNPVCEEYMSVYPEGLIWTDQTALYRTKKYRSGDSPLSYRKSCKHSRRRGFDHLGSAQSSLLQYRKPNSFFTGHITYLINALTGQYVREKKEDINHSS